MVIGYYFLLFCKITLGSLCVYDSKLQGVMCCITSTRLSQQNFQIDAKTQILLYALLPDLKKKKFSLFTTPPQSYYFGTKCFVL